jgi:hypothetical protein
MYNNNSVFFLALFRVVIVFVSEDSFQGKFNKNPYNFKRSFGTTNDILIKKVSLSLNSYDIDGLVTEDVELAYLRMFLFSDMRATGTTNGLSLDEFQGGYFFAFFDLSTSLSSSSVFQNPVTRQGQLRVSVSFSKSTTDNSVCLVYSEYPSVIKISENRKIETNYIT